MILEIIIAIETIIIIAITWSSFDKREYFPIDVFHKPGKTLSVKQLNELGMIKHILDLEQYNLENMNLTEEQKNEWETMSYKD